MNFDFRFYWTLFLRRLPLMAAFFLFCAGVGVALALKLPTTYTSQARMLVEAPQISDLQDVRTAGAEQLEIIQQSLMTRANLIDIANDRKVFGPDHGMSPDQVVRQMRDMTKIKKSAGRNKATTMAIGFNASTPRGAADVVNDYVTLILEENARLQGNRTDNTLAFFAQEVARLSTDLNLQSEKIVAFKQANAEALPDTLDFRLNRETLLQERVSLSERNIAQLREQRRRLTDVFEATGRVTAPQREQLSPEEQRLMQLNAELEAMRLRFSDTNPKVQILLSQIKQLEAQVAAMGGSSTGTQDNSQETYFKLQLAQIDSQIETIDANRQNDLGELTRLRSSIEATAANGIALAELERDYANIQAQYNGAVTRRDQAQISQSANSSGLIGRIRVIEPATVPDSPSSPNRPLVAAAGVGMGLASMGAIFFLLELLNRTIRRPAELTREFGITPLATIPYMQTKRHFWIRRSLKLILLLLVIVAIPLGLWAIDTYYSPLDLIYDRLLQKVGL